MKEKTSMELQSISLPKELESTSLVRFQDCDPYGHLNNARYIDYFMNARQDQLARDYSFDLFAVARQTNEAWVVTKTQIAYLLPAMLMEEVLIRTRLIHMSESTLVVEGIMLNQDATHLKAVAWIEFAFISLLTGKRSKHSEDFRRTFGAVVVEGIYEPHNFNSRVDTLKSQSRHGAMVREAV
jgi:acyl-CoA thioester hydrolase